jgi:glutathione synthase/RimK-type ligase-like ATP-grasp enzyme
MVRNLANGFVYVVEDNPPEDVVKQAKAALEASGLAFGAIDIKGAKNAHVLEINTAPGLEDRTAQAYAAKFREIYRGM